MAYSWLLWVAFFRGRIVKDPHYQDRPWISWKKAAICSKHFHLGHQQRSSTWKLNSPEVGERARFFSALGILPRVGANMDRQLVWIDLIKTPRTHQIWLMLKAHPCGNAQRSGGEGWPRLEILILISCSFHCVVFNIYWQGPFNPDENNMSGGKEVLWLDWMNAALAFRMFRGDQ